MNQTVYKVLFLFFITSSLSSHTALAYRGQEVASFTAPTDTPSQGLPGYFDASVVKSGKFILEVPTLSIDYGVTDRLTIGTNAIPWALAVIAKAPGMSLKTRYRFFSNEKIASSFTLYGGGLWTELKSSFSYFAGTTNTTYYIDRYTNVNFHLGVWSYNAVTAVTGPRNESMALSGILVLPGLGFQKFFNDSVGLETQVLYVAKTQASVDSTGVTGAADLLGNSVVFPYRLLLNIKTDENAMLSLGIMGLVASIGTGIKQVTLPSLSFTWMMQ